MHASRAVRKILRQFLKLNQKEQQVMEKQAEASEDPTIVYDVLTNKEQAVINAARVWRTSRGMTIYEPNLETIDSLVNAEASLASAIADLDAAQSVHSLEPYRYTLPPSGAISEFIAQTNSEPT